VVELVDTLVSGASAKSMLVRVQSWAPNLRHEKSDFSSTQLHWDSPFNAFIEMDVSLLFLILTTTC
jgi:hypothetical protein